MLSQIFQQFIVPMLVAWLTRKLDRLDKKINDKLEVRHQTEQKLRATKAKYTNGKAI